MNRSKNVRRSWNTENEFNYFNEILTKANSCEDLFDQNEEFVEKLQLREKQLLVSEKYFL